MQHRRLSKIELRQSQFLSFLIVHGNFLFMHGSSGTVRKNEIESRLQRGLSVNATALGKKFKVIVLGGEIDRETGAAIGLSAIREAERLSFDLCFLGACAVSVSLGIGAFQMADAEFKRTLITRSDRIAALVTMDKVETRAPFQVAALPVLDHLVLESGTSEEIVSTFSNAGPKVIIGQP